MPSDLKLQWRTIILQTQANQEYYQNDHGPSRGLGQQAIGLPLTKNNRYGWLAGLSRRLEVQQLSRPNIAQ